MHSALHALPTTASAAVAIVPCLHTHTQASLNARINILYFLDSLAETSSTLGPPDAPYLALITRDLPSIVDHVVPHRDGLLNLKSARAILDSWRARRVLDPSVVDAVLATLKERHFKTDTSNSSTSGAASSSSSSSKMSKTEVLRRIEEDRERQKRLRERMWILPIPPLHARGAASAAPTLNPSPASPSPFTPASPAPAGAATLVPGAGAPGSGSGSGRLMPPPPPPAAPVAPLDVEFDQMWETTSDLGEDDTEVMREHARQAAAAAAA